MSALLKKINSPADLKTIPLKELPKVAEEIRQKIIEVISRNGGHLAPSLGAVEIAVALHYILDTPNDSIVWDVGHQAYAHKILTGRLKQFDTIRQLGGLSGFPNRHESPYDCFTVGHSSTSISQALGLACARDLTGKNNKVVCVIGDAALAGGLALEALNHAGQIKKDIMIILNDNELSISKSVGALSRYLNRIMTNPIYNRIREDLQKIIKAIPLLGSKTFKAARKLEEGLKSLLVPGIIFEELGFRYFGPVNGHDLSSLITTFNNVLKLKEPRIVHVVTKKGKGYKFAEDRPSDFHGTSPFDIKSGIIKTKPTKNSSRETYSDVFGRVMARLGKSNKKIVAITAAMPDGTGLAEFSKEFPDRFFDVGIAEGHAITFSAGMARAGLRPIVAIYSTFLQRGYDQIIHDVSLQKLPVIFCVDRAGITGEDGPTHHGVFDIAFLRHIPNLTVMAPRDGVELEKMMEFALTLNEAVAIRYPKGSAASLMPLSSFKALKLGTSEMLREGKDLAIIAVGSMVSNSLKLADLLSEKGIEASVVNARFIKPLDENMLENVTSRINKIVTIEEGVANGGFGSAILEFIERENIKGVRVKRIALPDEFIEHGKRSEIFKKYHLTADEICENIMEELFGK
ncbi:MAG: 1-deoxy-D-xylulose-5-phosphate synthase [Candidatus Omnitrophica bacterium]|nr:1-deoxy-D-xylulose-5-phosphate synthase [Candidatus Omnitrophota bacterium]